MLKIPDGFVALTVADIPTREMEIVRHAVPVREWLARRNNPVKYPTPDARTDAVEAWVKSFPEDVLLTTWERWCERYAARMQDRDARVHFDGHGANRVCFVIGRDI